MDGDTQAGIETITEVSERSPLLQHSEHPTPLSDDDAPSYGACDTPPGNRDSQHPESSSIDEEASIATQASAEPAKRALSTTAILWIVAPLVLAVFVSNADSTIVIATHAIIASEFKALESSGWLFTGFMLASTVTQTTFGQLSDIYGRKPVIIAAYFIFGLGCLIVGLGQSMAMVIAGRVLSGAVSAGTSVLVSLVITDILPVREVAAWRSYVSVIGVIGRCMGGPLGGWLADVVGWRLSFIGQAPLFFIALILAWLSLPSRPKGQAHEIIEPKLSKFRRVDLLGSALLAVFLLLLLLPMELGGSKLSWTDPWIGVCLVGAVVALALFIAAEKFWVASPLLPLEIFHNKHTVASFAIMALQCAAQLGLMFSVPLYFQVTQHLSNTAAGSRLLPAVIGNAVGGIMAGYFIRTTGNYRWLISLASLISASSYILVIWRWHGHTGWAETLYIFPGGFATGVALSAVFIAVQAAVDKKLLAPAVSVLYLAQGLGCAVGVAATSAATQIGLRATLQTRLVNMHLDAELQKEIIEKAASSVEYIYKTRGDIADAIVASYVDGIWLSHFVSLFASVLAFGLSALLRKYKL